MYECVYFINTRIIMNVDMIYRDIYLYIKGRASRPYNVFFWYKSLFLFRFEKSNRPASFLSYLPQGPNFGPLEYLAYIWSEMEMCDMVLSTGVQVGQRQKNEDEQRMMSMFFSAAASVQLSSMIGVI